MPRSLLDIESLSSCDFNEILALAQRFATGDLPSDIRQMANIPTVANMFYENSTRTLVSFELAAKRLGYYTTTIDISSSSESKGEDFLDTLKTLSAMSIEGFIIRHNEEHLIEKAQKALPNCAFINAGDGMHAHPSQALLDALTIQQKFQNLTSLSVAIVGDIRHSRVTKSLVQALYKLGIKDIRLCAPDYFLPTTPLDNVVIEPSLSKALEGANVIYSLRVQKERFNPLLDWSMDDYINDYRLSSERLRWASKNRIVMHPGPVNRNIEICSKLVDSKDSVILQQVQNGVFVRMAILYWAFLYTP